VNEFPGDALLAIAGAIVGQLASVISKDDPEGTVRRIKALGLWIAVAFQCLVAVVLVYAYLQAGQKLGSILSMNIGVSADVILRGVTRVASTTVLPGSTDHVRK
jgi:hypothetical protein